uniref:Uncharacterized protein n=1 Tax=Anguilla anguilla TaxID=7936 RepID=A0A0E9PR85_ANGAN
MDAWFAIGTLSQGNILPLQNTLTQSEIYHICVCVCHIVM